MKKYIIPIALAAFAINTTSCKKELQAPPISQATPDVFFQSQDDFNKALTGIYSVGLRGTTIGNSYGYPDRQLNLSETRSDNLYAITDGTRGWEGINNFYSTLANNTYVEEAWVNNYNAIAKANLFLEKMEAQGRNYITSEETYNTMMGEARFLRAFLYFDLVRWFGKVPLVTKTVLPAEAATIGRSPVSDVYDLILADLDFAIENLPPEVASANKGRANAYVAKAYKALVHMTRSGTTYGIEGPGLGVNEWAQAASLLDEVLAAPQYGFVDNYASIFSYSNEGNKEVIFDVQYQSGGQGIGGSFVWILTPDQYFNSLGLNNQGANYQRPVSNNLLSDFDTAVDLRYKHSIQTGFTYQTQTFDYSFYKKYIDVSKYGSSRTDWPINYIAMRYTDVMMLKAECILNGGGAGSVDEIVNQVRTRAGLEAVTGVNTAQLMEERRREFCGEGLRWHDLVRSGLVSTVMPAWIAADDVSNMILPFNNNYVIYPVPQREMNVLPGLYSQNIGYD